MVSLFDILAVNWMLHLVDFDGFWTTKCRLNSWLDIKHKAYIRTKKTTNMRELGEVSKRGLFDIIFCLCRALNSKGTKSFGDWTSTKRIDVSLERDE